MPDRPYYTDAYTRQFTARVREWGEENGRFFVVLDQTYFYPTSGGQPHDTGTLQQGERGARVLGVEVRESDDAVVHVLDAPLEPGEVAADIDWARRFDHMQHHTGQHILSQAFVRVAAAETVGFHLSGQSVTIDLDRHDLTPETIQAAEELANRIVWDDRPVHIRDVSRDEALSLPLRKVPPTRDGRLRLIDIDAFDLTACGGTHVAHTGEVGVIKVLKTERRGTTLRVEFCCGRRALEDYRQKHAILQGLSAALTTGHGDLLPAVSRLQDEAKQLRSDLKRQQAALLGLEAERLLAEAAPLGEARLVVTVFEGRAVEDVRQIGSALAESGRTVALLGIAGDRAHLIFSRSADAPAKMGELIRPALAALGEAKGGGGPTFAQGGGPAADVATVRAALETAASRLRQTVDSVESG